jgi:hypothetical protein
MLFFHCPIALLDFLLVVQGRLSWCSNVWSFGVTAWEVLGLCREQPWAGLNDVAILRNAEALYYEGKQQVRKTRAFYHKRIRTWSWETSRGKTSLR